MQMGSDLIQMTVLLMVKTFHLVHISILKCWFLNNHRLYVLPICYPRWSTKTTSILNFKIYAMNHISSVHVHIFSKNYIKDWYFQFQYCCQNYGYTSEQWFHRKKSTASMVKMEHWLILKKRKSQDPL